MEINDKRKFSADGEKIAVEEAPIEIIKPQFAISDIPCVYSDPNPIKNYILVRQQAKETYFAGTRFAIPESAQQNPNKGVVVAVGPEVAECKCGDVVTFGRYNAEPLDIDGDEFQLVSIHDVKLVEQVTYAILNA